MADLLREEGPQGRGNQSLKARSAGRSAGRPGPDCTRGKGRAASAATRQWTPRQIVTARPACRWCRCPDARGREQATVKPLEISGGGGRP